MPSNLENFQQSSYSTYYSPINYSSTCCLSCYPLQEIQSQNVIQTGSLEVVDNYPNIYITRFFKNKKEKYHYKIWRLGHYPSHVKQTQRSNYLIPNGYMVGVRIYGVDTIAETQYDSSDKVVYTVTWDDNNGEKKSISSNKSASNVATLLLQKLTGNNKSLLSGTILFGFDLECLKKRRIDQDQNPIRIQKNKPYHQLRSESQKKVRLQNLAYKIHSEIESIINSHNFYNTKLEHLELNIDGSYIKLRNVDLKKPELSQHLDSIIRVCDESLITRNGYRQLAAIMPDMEREYKVGERRQEITRIMNNIIPVHVVQIASVTPNGAYRSLKNILHVLISKLAYKDSPVLRIGDIVHVKLSGDGRQVGKHHNHVMFTACILNEHEAVLSPQNQHCIFLYTGTEQYESLQQAFSLLIDELLSLNTEGIIDSNNNHWPIEFWFGSDWKFMSLVLGTKGPTAIYFCLYCDCKSTDRWNMDLDYENLCNTQGRKNFNLLPFLENQHCIPDELHIMLRITDVLFECFFLELSTEPSFNKRLKNNTGLTIRERIELTIHSLGINIFKFKEPETSKGRWYWTSLMGPDKLDLTDEDIINFKTLARQWVKNFCQPTIETKEGKILQEGLYQRDDITPYMHVLACHIPKFMKFLKTKNLNLRWFSCSGIEKKNHNHVQLFYGGTTMGGGNSLKPAAYEI
ncbi:1696_t:CDS:2, partial [Scutellospora calospora]